MANNILADTSFILNTIMREKGITTDSELAQLMGISPQGISKWRNRNTYNVGLLLLAFPDLSPRWLILGDGPMYADPTQQPFEEAHTGASNGGSYSVGSSKQATNQAGRSMAKIKEENEELREQITALKEQLAQANQSIEHLSRALYKLIDRLDTPPH